VLRSPLLYCLVAVTALALLAAACSRSTRIVTPSTSTTALGRDLPVSCPNMIPNTPETAVPFAAVSALCPSFRSSRLRFEMTGDLPSPRIDDMGACATSAVPSIQFAGGHANVFLHGTNTSVTLTGQPLTFGPLQVPQTGEAGVVLAVDPGGNVLQVIWPTLAGVGAGQPIVRVQLLNWNSALVVMPNTFDIVWDMTVVRDSVTMHIAGRAENVNLTGLPTAQAGLPPQPPCIATLAATSDLVIPQFAGIVQFRANRARFEVWGDVASGAVEGCGSCAAADAPSVRFIRGFGDVLLAGTDQSLTAGGQALAFGPLLFPGITLEPGVVLATDASGDILEIIWPKLAALGSGPPILRLELTSWNPALRTNQHVDVSLRFDAEANDGSTATYVAMGHDVVVPLMK